MLRAAALSPSPDGDCRSCAVRPTCRALCGPALERADLPDPEARPEQEIAKAPAVAEYLASVAPPIFGGPIHHEGPDEDDGASSVRSLETERWLGQIRSAHTRLVPAIERMLSPDQRAVLVALLRGRRQRDIAADMGITDESVCIMLRRARIRLAAFLRCGCSGCQVVA